jgi:hypothetical protein
MIPAFVISRSFFTAAASTDAILAPSKVSGKFNWAKRKYNRNSVVLWAYAI